METLENLKEKITLVRCMVYYVPTWGFKIGRVTVRQGKIKVLIVIWSD